MYRALESTGLRGGFGVFPIRVCDATFQLKIAYKLSPSGR
jgi:hypothetical protein